MGHVLGDIILWEEARRSRVSKRLSKAQSPEFIWTICQRGHMQVVLIHRKYDTPEDYKNYALKRPEALNIEVIISR
jgi:hypothetical protein